MAREKNMADRPRPVTKRGTTTAVVKGYNHTGERVKRDPNYAEVRRQTQREQVPVTGGGQDKVKRRKGTRTGATSRRR